MSDTPTVILQQNQTDKALDIKDPPANIDDSSGYSYSAAVDFIIDDYTTLVQDITNILSPPALPGNLAPSTSSFILQLNGSGFNSGTFAADPFKIFAKISDAKDGYYYAIIPPLPTSINLSNGSAYGYIVKSDKTIWIYFNKLLAQKIWFKTNDFTGADTLTKVAIETGNSHYDYLNRAIPNLVLYLAPNNDFKPYTNILADLDDTSIPITLTQSPYIITTQSQKRGTLFVPYASQISTDKVEFSVHVFGHELANNSVMLVKASSKLLVNNPSKLPTEVINRDQSESTIQSMTLQEVQNLEYFKEGNFLGSMFVGSVSEFDDYNFFATDDKAQKIKIQNSGKIHLPDDVPTIKFVIKTLPADTYIVVIYDSVTGLYAIGPNLITFQSKDIGIQIHDVSPNPVVLQGPKFTINGFGFPIVDDLNNGISVIVTMTGSGLSTDENSGLQINSTSTIKDINGRGSIKLISASQMVAEFEAINFIPSPNDDPTIYLTVSLFNNNIGPGLLQHQDCKSPSITIQSPPVIKFLTNDNMQPESTNGNGQVEDASKSKSLVRIDQKTGNVIAYGETGINTLYIVGKNFGLKKNISVLLNGKAQTVSDVIQWDNGDDPDLSAIIVETQANSDIKDDATLEVRNGSISSEPFILMPKPFFVLDSNQNFLPSGRILKGELLISTTLFADNIPYNQFSEHYELLNNKNTKVASSLQVKLQNSNTKEVIELRAGLDQENSVPIKFIPNTIIVPANTPLAANGTLNLIFNFYGAFNVNFSTPKIIRLQHENGDYANHTFAPAEIMTVVGTGFVDGMRYNINDTGWHASTSICPLIEGKELQSFEITVPPKGTSKNKPSVLISNDQADSVYSANTAGKQNGAYHINTIVINDRYSPLLKINQRLPAGIKMYAKGPQITITDKIDANLSIYTQVTPFLGSFKTLLIVVRIIVCIIDVICALVNPFKLIIAIIALMDCIIDLLSLFPQLAVPIMILSFLQNFIGFLQTFIQQLTAYVFSIVNSQLSLLRATLAKDFAVIAAAEQQAFGAVKQIRDVVSFLEPALQIIQIFKDLLNFAMHFPCASNQGSDQNNNSCPPENMQQLIKSVVGKDTVPANTYSATRGNISRTNGIVTVVITNTGTFKPGDRFALDPGEVDFVAGIKNIATVIDDTHFTYLETGNNVVSVVDENIGMLVNDDQQATLATMFCQAVALQTITLQTMPGVPFQQPSGTSIIPNLAPSLPNISAAIECMNNLTDRVESALNAGQIFITTEQQGEELVAAYTQCAQNLLDQTTQSLGDVCALAVSALNSELKVSPRGNIGPNLSDDFIKTKIALPSTQPNDVQDAGLVIDLATILSPSNIPSNIGTDMSTNTAEASLNFGLKQDMHTPIIIQTNNKTGQRQSIDTIYFNAENQDVSALITIGDILEIVGGTFNGLQFPIIGIQPIFTAIRLKVKLDLTFEQKLLVGEQPIPSDLSGFDVKIIAHLASNDAVAVVVADDLSVATIQIMARDHHGHLIGPGLANKVSIKLESGQAEFVPVSASAQTDVTGVIQESGDFYIANLKSNCAGTVIVSASVCDVQFKDVGYHANDTNHAITTRIKTVKIIFTPPIPIPTLGNFNPNVRPQVIGTELNN